MTKATRRPLRVSAETPYRKWPELLTLEEVAVLLAVSRKTVQRMCAADELPVERHGRLKHIHKSALKPKETA